MFAAVDEDAADSEMVEVAVEVDREAEVVHGEVDLVGRPAVDEAYAHHRQESDDIAARFGGAIIAHGCYGFDVVPSTQDGGDSAVTEVRYIKSNCKNPCRRVREFVFVLLVVAWVVCLAVIFFRELRLSLPKESISRRSSYRHD